MLIGTIKYTGVTVSDAPQMIKGRVRLYQENLLLEMDLTPMTQRPGIKRWQQTPTPHFITLFEQIQRGEFLTTRDGAHDINDFFMLQYETPIQLFDTDKLTNYTVNDIIYTTQLAPVDTQTTKITQVFLLKDLPCDEAQQLLQAAAKMFWQINGGDYTITLEEYAQ